MSLVDSSDGVLMVGAYGWAFMNPVRKLSYNLVITGFSVVAAVLVGAIEALGLIGDNFGLEGGLWVMADATGAHFGTLGYLVIAIFVATWLVSFVVYRATGYPKIPTLDHS
jgi:nickel/cobalt transporter (NiCoT) family protein